MADDDGGQVELGHLNGPWGTDGWVKVYSLTSPPENIFEYQPWQTDRPPGLFRVLQWRQQGPRLVARIDAISTREQAEARHGARLFTERNTLPPAGPESYYWHDLIGLQVVNRAGLVLGRVSGFLDAGVHDVLCVEAPDSKIPLLIPFVPGHYILAVEPAQGNITVDWEPEWSTGD
ncbi:MAG: ribosome maturation factor RimM [Wenzhouxiangellaceae bacterium]|nr:ribosome maturation factor RimM [Wenzhouxiangellaceae bacterium]